MFQTPMRDLCYCRDSMNKIIILQHNAIKSSFEKIFHVVGHVFNVTRCNKLLDFVLKYASQNIGKEIDRVEYVGLDKSHCRCTLTFSNGIPCSCELTSFCVGSIRLQSMHFI